jgi:hypothetical protein
LLSIVLSRAGSCKTDGSCKMSFFKRSENIIAWSFFRRIDGYLYLKFLTKKGGDRLFLPCDFENIVQYCVNSEESGLGWTWHCMPWHRNLSTWLRCAPLPSSEISGHLVLLHWRYNRISDFAWHTMDCIYWNLKSAPPVSNWHVNTS